MMNWGTVSGRVLVQAVPARSGGSGCMALGAANA